MPIYRILRDLHYFAHVPKCGGASVEVYLRERFGPIAFANSQYLNTPETLRWTRSSPQHVDWEALTLLLPTSWIKSSFAVVRHPVARLRSAFDYQLNGEKTVPEGTNLNDWFLDWVAQRDKLPFRYDNHLRPASDLVPRDATIFRLEDGLDPIVNHLDRLAGNSHGPRQMPHENKSRGGKHYTTAQSPLRNEILDVIEKVYAKDFKRFGYTCDDTLNSSARARHGPRTRKLSLARLMRLR